MKKQLMAVACAAGLLLTSCNLGGSLNVAAGQSRPDGFQTIGGAIDVGEGATVEKGTLSTVTGRINVGAKATVADINTTSGSIQIGDGATAGRVEAGNGSITVGSNATIRSLRTATGTITIGTGTAVEQNVNTTSGNIVVDRGVTIGGVINSSGGHIRLTGATVTGEVSTHSKGVELAEGATLAGDLRIRPGTGLSNTEPLVVIGKDCTVSGRMIFDRSVRLFVHESATVGEVQGATATSYSGDTLPPN